ncbi:SH3 domain-containing protein [Chondromyces crocatus]|nr:SH3 domain-containing protein [Chondromyces crocatus]
MKHSAGDGEPGGEGGWGPDASGSMGPGGMGPGGMGPAGVGYGGGPPLGPGEPLPSALAPPSLVQVASPPPKQGTLKPLLVICGLAVVSAAICGGVILYSQGRLGGSSEAGGASSGDGEKRSALPGEPLPPVITEGEEGAAPGGTPAGNKTMRAVVSLAEGQPRAVLRSKPDFKGDMVAFLPQGASVEITNSTTAGGGTWFRVKTVDAPTPASGWVHGAVLKIQ